MSFVVQFPRSNNPPYRIFEKSVFSGGGIEYFPPFKLTNSGENIAKICDLRTKSLYLFLGFSVNFGQDSSVIVSLVVIILPKSRIRSKIPVPYLGVLQNLGPNVRNRPSREPPSGPDAGIIWFRKDFQNMVEQFPPNDFRPFLGDLGGINIQQTTVSLRV